MPYLKNFTVNWAKLGIFLTQSLQKKLLVSESKGYTVHPHEKVEKRRTEATLLPTINSMTGTQLLSALGSLTLKDHSHKWARSGNGSRETKDPYKIRPLVGVSDEEKDVSW